MTAKNICIVFLTLFIGYLWSNVLHVDLSADISVIEQDMMIPGFNKLQVPGTPILPVKSIMFALPPGAQIISVDFSYDRPLILGESALPVAQPSLPMNNDRSILQDALVRWQYNQEYLVNTNRSFPEKIVYFSKMSHFRNIPFVRIVYFPILYERGSLRLYSNVHVAVHFSNKPMHNQITEWQDHAAQMYFANWSDMKKHYSVYDQPDSGNYVIITKDYLFSAFDSLLAWKNNIGFSATIVNYDSILNQYPGNESADKIRNFLIDKYDNWGIQYVLIGGNVDLIPMKICFPDPGHNYDTPTDYYYAELTDDWDSDADGYYGEYDQDSIGFVPEILVGRFPYNDLSTLSSIVMKTVDFERDTGAWKRRALLLGAFSNFANEDGSGWPDCDGAALMENVKDSVLAGWTYTRMYEEAGLCASVYPHEQALTQSNVVAEWSSGQYAITNWSGHGNANGAYRKYWAYDDGDSIPESSEISWATFIHTSDAPSLDNDHASIVFSASCSNASTTENIARALINNGASGIVAATSYGWYTPGWNDPSDGNIMSLDYYFFYYLIAENQTVGQALFNAKMFYFNYLYFPDPWAGDPAWTPQQNMLDYTLFGDPALVRQYVGIVETNTKNIANVMFCVYPNPVHKTGYLTYSIPDNGNVLISLYNALGQRVEVLYQGKEKAGNHTVQFSQKDLVAGVYFVTMEFSDLNNKSIKAQQKIILF